MFGGRLLSLHPMSTTRRDARGPVRGRDSPS
jgi:hypothetical protein